MTDRRGFLKGASTGLVGVPFLAALAEVQRAFAQDLQTRSGANLRSDYLLADGLTYLNHASIGTVPRVVHDVRLELLRLCETNPWLYMWGGAWEQPREDVRAKTALRLGCQPEEVTFTHNTTEAFNMLAHGLPLGPGDEVLFSSLNHTGASAPFFHMAGARGFTVNRFQYPVTDVPGAGAQDVLAAYDEHITPRTKLIVLPHIDNMVGIRHPVRKIARHARSRGVEFIVVDGAQPVGMIPIDLQAMNVDLYATSPHKWLQSPKGLGIAYVSAAAQQHLRPMWVTWGQNRWKGTARVYEDYGTRNLAEVLTLGAAIDFNRRLDDAQRRTRLQQLWHYTREKADNHPRTTWVSPLTWELGASLYSVAIKGKDSGPLAQQMFEEHGFVFRPFQTQGLNAVRLSPNVFNTEEEIDRFFDIATA